MLSNTIAYTLCDMSVQAVQMMNHSRLICRVACNYLSTQNEHVALLGIWSPQGTYQATQQVSTLLQLMRSLGL